MRRIITVVCVACFSFLLPVAPAGAGKVALFDGGGWGHGLGMSQYGAYGRAVNGASSETILEHYYSGTNVSDQTANMPANVRVGLLQAQSEIRAKGNGRVEWQVRGAASPFVSGTGADTWKVTPAAVGGIRLYKNGTLVKKDGKRVWGSSDDPVDLLYEPNNTIARVLDTGIRYKYGKLEFGTYKSSACSVGYCTRLVLVVPMQKYLYGLGEMPSSWPSQALQSQAITGRTYALRRIRRDGQHRVGCDCAVYDSPIDQAYIGDAKRDADGNGSADTYWSNWKGAVDATNGEVLMFDGSLAQTLYSSSSGGHTENNELVWGTGSSDEAIPYLRGVSDKADKANGINPNFKWTTRMTWTQLSDRLNAYFGIGQLKRFELVPPFGVSGRVTVVRASGGGGVKIVGTNRTVRVDGWDIRSALGLRDTLFDFKIVFTIDPRLKPKHDALNGAPGNPVGDSYGVPRKGTNKGIAQDFQVGRLTRRSSTDRTVWQWGAVLKAYDARGREGGALGMPTSDVFGKRFKGAWYVRGFISVLDGEVTVVPRKYVHAYERLNGPRGPLGLPVAEPDGQSNVAPNGRQRFEDGAIYRNGDLGASFGLWDRINRRYIRTGGGSGRCGLPTKDMRRTDDGYVARFQHGRIRQTGDAIEVDCS